MEDLFSIAGDLASFLSSKELLRCYVACKTWRGSLSNNSTIWRRIVLDRWKIFACPIYGMVLKEHVTCAMYEYIIGRLKLAEREPVYDCITQSVHWAVTHGWSGFNNGHCRRRFEREDFVIRSFKEHGYEIMIMCRTASRIWFGLVNEGVWLSLTDRLDRNVVLDEIDDGMKHCVIYFSKLSGSIVGSDVTHGWSGYINGQAQKPTSFVVRDFIRRGYMVDQDTDAEIIFRKITNE